MAQVSKIDSNVTGLAYAEEAALGFLPGEGGHAGSPDWKRLNPNSYDDFGGQITTVSPNPINPSRQRRKGVTTDLDASGGFNQNLTFENLTDLMQGVMFSDIRRKGMEPVTAVDVDGANPDEFEVAETEDFIVGTLVKGRGFSNSTNNGLFVVTAIVADTSVEVVTGSLVDEASPPVTAVLINVGYQFAADAAQITIAGDFPRLIDATATLDFTTLGIVPGQWVFVGGDASNHKFTAAVDNGFKRVRTVDATGITFDKSDAAMSNETASGGKIVRLFFGDVLKNETGSLIVRRSYNVERTLGVPDDAAPSEIQSEVLIGAVPNEFTLNVPQANLATVDISFVATNNEQRVGSTGPKQTSVDEPIAATEFNTSSDMGRIRLAVVDDTTEAPTALFAYVTEAKVTINNNVSPNKAVAVLGAFDVTAGTFEVSGSLTAYFGTVEATAAVRNNSNVTLDLSFVKDNTAMIYDLPLIALGDGRLNVEIDEPITLPLDTDAATAIDIHPDLDHTLLITYFNYVPDAA